jgi:glucose/arabinose dehydrogenase
MKGRIVLALGAALLGVLMVGAKGCANAPAEPSLISIQPVISSGLRHPLYLAEVNDGSGRLFILEQPGRIRIVRSGSLVPVPFLDITARVRSSGAEQGLLGLAFHPAFKSNGRYFVNYTREPDGATVIAEYSASADPDVSERTEKVLLVIPDPYTNHNGGMVEFGPDGLLYIATGDGGSRGDPENRGQNRNELLGKILRIDVDHGKPYAAPSDNPFAAGGGRPEIFAYGLRNPWRFSFDRKTGELWAADVGQNDWEEIDVVKRGGNYGWRLMEGAHCFLPKQGCPTEGLTLPVAEYANRSPRCSITGGYVYRGEAVPVLQGSYVYGDYCSGEVMALVDGQQKVLLPTELRISSFGQDQAGELYVVGHEGSVHKIVPPLPSSFTGSGARSTDVR